MNSAILQFPEPNNTPRLTYAEVEVTPELAQQWLGLNTANRKLKAGQVAAFARDMAAGRWVLNGETIKLAGPAYAPTKLLDGQNRLHAVLKSRATVRLAVVFGVSETSQITMDSGAKRTVGDNLTIAGINYATMVAAAAKLALRVEMKRLTAADAVATNAAVEEFIYQNPDLVRSAAVASSYAYKADVPPSLVAYTHWRLAKINLDQATGFWRDAAEKVGLSAGDPVIALTNRFADSRRNRQRVPVEAALSGIYRAWNARRAGEPLRLLRLNSPTGGLVGVPEPK